MKHISPVATWLIKPVEPLFAICEGAWLSPGEGVPNRGNCWELISTCKTSHSILPDSEIRTNIERSKHV